MRRKTVTVGSIFEILKSTKELTFPWRSYVFYSEARIITPSHHAQFSSVARTREAAVHRVRK